MGIRVGTRVGTRVRVRAGVRVGIRVGVGVRVRARSASSAASSSLASRLCRSWVGAERELGAGSVPLPGRVRARAGIRGSGSCEGWGWS